MTMPETETAVIEYRPPAGQMVPVEEVKAALEQMHQLVKDVLIEGVHYGVQQGTDQKALKKPGAEEVFKAFLCRPEYEDMAGTGVNVAEQQCTFRYKCRAIRWDTGEILAEGIGSCSSLEKKYHLRHSDRTCPTCGKATIKVSKYHDANLGHKSLYCFAKIGGCGAKFPAGSIPPVEDRETTLEEWADLINTIDKMAQKRAMVACALTLGAVSAMFTQDIDEAWEEGEYKAAETPMSESAWENENTAEGEPAVRTVPPPKPQPRQPTGGEQRTDPRLPPEEQPAPIGQVNLVTNRFNDVPEDVQLALCEKYGVEVAYDDDGKLRITDASKLTGGAKGTAEAMVAELNLAKKVARGSA